MRTLRSARHTALLHLKPLPNAICHTRSPRRTPLPLSMLASTYQMLLLLVLPNLLPYARSGTQPRFCNPHPDAPALDLRTASMAVVERDCG